MTNSGRRTSNSYFILWSLLQELTHWNSRRIPTVQSRLLWNLFWVLQEYRYRLLLSQNSDRKSWNIRQKLLSAPSISFYCISSLLCFIFSGRNFVREADGSNILEEFRINYKAIWFLQSEFFKNFNKDSFLEQTKELNEIGDWRFPFRTLSMIAIRIPIEEFSEHMALPIMMYLAYLFTDILTFSISILTICATGAIFSGIRTSLKGWRDLTGMKKSII